MAAEMINGRFLLLGNEPRTGGLAEVRKAVDTTSSEGAFAAIKLLRERDDDAVLEVFLARETEALKKLDHPNIVRMLDSGWDTDLERYFIALEWVDRSLKEDLADGRPVGWDAYFERIGRPLIGALAYAHTLQIEHRDLKPANVLLMEDGTPKLADFGIAKIRSKVTVTDETVADWRSGLYAPPEREEPLPYVRDVFAFGVLALQVLSGSKATDYPHLAEVLNDLDLAPEIRAVLARCIDFDPKGRPANAAVLEQQLLVANEICSNRQARRTHYVWLKVTRGAAESLTGVPRGTDPDWARAEAAALADLGGTVHVDYGYNPQTKETDTTTICVAGNEWYFRLKPDDEPRRERSVIVTAAAKSADWLARWREKALAIGPTVNWSFKNPGVDAAYQGRELLLDRLDEHKAQQQEADQAQQEQRLGDLFEAWGRLLDAREELAAQGREQLEYTGTSGSGRTLIFHLTTPSSASLVGEEWSVAAFTQGRPIQRGEVTAQTDQTLTLRFRHADTRVPDRGVLLPYVGPSQTALNRQRDALAAVAAGQSANRLLGDIIDDPSALKTRPPADVTDWFRSDLDSSKRDVVRHALGGQDLVLVEGPPGTGKTTVIAEIVEQTLARSPDARILIVSQTHIAIDNALRRIEEAGVNDIVRLGRPDDSRVAASAQHLLLNRQIRRWTKRVRTRAEAHLDEVATKNGVEARHLKAALHLEELAAVAADLGHVTSRLEELNRQPIPERTTAVHELGEEVLTAQARRDQLLEQRRELFSSVQQTLAGDLTLREDMTATEARDAVQVLLGPKGSGQALMELLRLQGEWLQRVDTDPNLLAAYLTTRRVVGGTALGFLGHPAARNLEFDVCIFDEASKATATESLVPLARARRWILVGDTRQLPPLDEDILRDQKIMDDHQLIPELVTTTLFSYLARHTSYPVKHLLREQYRMTPAIGNMISTVFYGEELRSPNPSALAGYATIGKPVLWIDTARLPARRESERRGTETSISNRLEAQLTRNWLQVLDRAIDHGVITPPNDRALEVLVIAPYGRQVEELESKLTGAKLAHLSVDVLSVDAVQGRECDLAVFSVTRSNNRSDFGFLGQPYWRRINVALSRARFGLTVVGDATFCRSKPGALRDVLDYMTSHREDCEVRDAHL